MEQAIGWFVFAGSCLVFAICFLVSNFWFKRGERFFEENCRETVAKLKGFGQNINSRNNYPVVQFEDEGAVQEEQAHSNGKCYPNYPVGAPIRIRYCKRKTMGIEVYDVRVTEPGYEAYPRRITEKILQILGLLFLVLTILFIFMGIREI